MSSYSDYSVRLSFDGSAPAFYASEGPNVARIFYRVVRVPSKKEFIVHVMPGATDKERRWVESHLDGVPGTFAYFQRDFAQKRRSRKGPYYYWSMVCGFRVEDPFMQLELEMMLDAGAPLSERPA